MFDIEDMNSDQKLVINSIFIKVNFLMFLKWEINN